MRQLFFCKTIITDSFKPYGRNRNGLHVFKEMTENKENKAYKIRNIILTVGTILLAAAIIILHITLIFDRVVWGDEAFSANIIRGTNYAGIFERVYYLENHPPLYYYESGKNSAPCRWHFSWYLQVFPPPARNMSRKSGCMNCASFY